MLGNDDVDLYQSFWTLPRSMGEPWTDGGKGGVCGTLPAGWISGLGCGCKSKPSALWQGWKPGVSLRLSRVDTLTAAAELKLNAAEILMMLRIEVLRLSRIIGDQVSTWLVDNRRSRDVYEVDSAEGGQTPAPWQWGGPLPVPSSVYLSFQFGYREPRVQDEFLLACANAPTDSAEALCELVPRTAVWVDKMAISRPPECRQEISDTFAPTVDREDWTSEHQATVAKIDGHTAKLLCRTSHVACRMSTVRMENAASGTRDTGFGAGLRGR